MTPRQILERGQEFFGVRIWATRLDQLSRGRAILYRACRTLYATAQGFFEKELTVRAASLTYYTVLSIVPFLAFAFSVLKGFGVYHRLMEGSLQPYLRETFAGDPALLGALQQILTFVERTNVSGLSVVGVLVLLYTAIAMLSTVETALNDIWDARESRTLLRKVTDYTTMMVAGPLLVMAALTIAAAAQNSAFVAFLRRSMLLGQIVNLALSLIGFGLISIAFIALYVIMPNVRTRLPSALVGGVVAGLSWHVVLLLQVKFQMGVARYNALYAGFAALPIFLVWIYISWTIVLVGAQLSASHQYETRFKQAVRSRHVDQELREALAVVVAAAVGRRFLEGRPPASATDLAEALELPPPLVDQVLDALVRAGVLVRVAGQDTPAYDPARDVDAVRLCDLEEAVRLDPNARALKGTLERTAGPALSTVLRSRHDEATHSSGGLTLRELANRWGVALDPVRPRP